MTQPNKTKKVYFLTSLCLGCLCCMDKKKDCLLMLSTAQKILLGRVHFCQATKPSCGEVLRRLEILLSVFFTGKLCFPHRFSFFFSDCRAEIPIQSQVKILFQNRIMLICRKQCIMLSHLFFFSCQRHIFVFASLCGGLNQPYAKCSTCFLCDSLLFH